MAEFLFVHGSCHGAWCWRDVLPLVEARGHVARAIDLPSAGLDPAPPETVTLADCRDTVVAAMHRPTILVGHSFGGITTTAAAAAAPDKIAALVFLAAWAPQAGESGRDLRVRYGCENLMAAMRMSEDRKTSTFAEETLEAFFFHDCPPGTTDYARDHLTAQPTAPATVPADPVPDTVPRHYIRCTADRIIPPDAQADQCRDWPEDRIHSMDCGHSPFFAAPAALTDILIRIAEET